MNIDSILPILGIIGGIIVFFSSGYLTKHRQDKKQIETLLNIREHADSTIEEAAQKMKLLTDHQSTILAIKENNTEWIEKAKEAKTDEDALALVADLVRINNDTARMQNNRTTDN